MKKISLLLLCAAFPLTLAAQQNWKAVVRYDKQAAKADLVNRLQKYAQADSNSQLHTTAVPSTKQQLSFAKNLAKELKHIGAANVHLSKTGIVTAEIPATQHQSAPVLALVAHLDAAPQARAQQPQFHSKYTHGDMLLNKAKNLRLTEENSPQLLRAHGHDFLTTDGQAPFGADTKAGLAIVMTLADYLLGNRGLQHGTIRIVLLPDQLSFAGASALEVEKLGANYAFILDGKDQGEIALENFSGQGFTIVFEGRRDIALGQASSSAFTDNLLMASDFHTLLPRHSRPETTSGKQGYITVDDISTRGNRTTITGHLRAFNEKDLQRLNQQVKQAFNTVKVMYPRRATAELSFEEPFQNAANKIPPTLVQALESAFRQEDLAPKRVAVRNNTDFAILTLRGLPTLGVFTGVFNGAEPLEYVDVDIMEASLRGMLSLVTADLTSLQPAR